MKPVCELTWIIEDRLFFLKWPQIVDADVIRDYTHQVMEAMDSSKSDNVHYISDTRPMKGFPSMKESKQLLDSFKHPKMGWTISLGGFNPAMKTMVHIVSGALGIRVHTVTNIDEAVRFLNESDPSLPPLSQYKSKLDQLADDV